MPKANEERKAGPKSHKPIARRGAIDFNMVCDIGLTLPDVEESTAYGSPVLKLHGKILAGIAVNRSAESGSLMLCMDSHDRAELLAADPEVYYTTDHYGPNGVLVRLSRVNPEVLRDLLGVAYKFVVRKAARRSPARKRR